MDKILLSQELRAVESKAKKAKILIEKYNFLPSHACKKLHISQGHLEEKISTGDSLDKRDMGRSKWMETPDIERIQKIIKERYDIGDSISDYELLDECISITHEKKIHNDSLLLSKRIHLPENLPNADWLGHFLAKYQVLFDETRIKTDNPEKIEKVDIDEIGNYFKIVDDFLKKFNLKPGMIFNFDESYSKEKSKRENVKVIIPKGAKTAKRKSTGMRTSHVSVLALVNDLGNSGYPTFLMKDNPVLNTLRERSFLNQHGRYIVDPNHDDMTLTLFLRVTKEFIIPEIKRNRNCLGYEENEPAILILDNHSSRNNEEALVNFRKNNIHLITLPPNTTPVYQVLDVSCFAPFQLEYSRTNVPEWAKESSLLTSKLIRACIAFKKKINISNIQSGFRAVKITPLQIPTFEDLKAQFPQGIQAQRNFAGKIIQYRPSSHFRNLTSKEAIAFYAEKHKTNIDVVNQWLQENEE